MMMLSKYDMNPIFEAMSAMQKSIRRNKPKDAYYFALKVEEFNPKMLWNRLQEIVSEDIGIANPTLPLTFNVLREWYFEKMEKGKHGHLYLIHAILLMATGAKSRDTVNLLKTVDFGMEFEGLEIPIPDYALDRHTLRGKKRGRGWEHFFNEACKLENDASNPDWASECSRLVSKYPRPSQGTKQEQKAKYAYNQVTGKAKTTAPPTGLDTFFDEDDTDDG